MVQAVREDLQQQVQALGEHLRTSQQQYVVVQEQLGVTEEQLRTTQYHLRSSEEQLQAKGSELRVCMKTAEEQAATAASLFAALTAEREEARRQLRETGERSQRAEDDSREIQRQVYAAAGIKMQLSGLIHAHTKH
jgi:predicted  nucleic acid-binding Zn-ribbon protein